MIHLSRKDSLKRLETIVRKAINGNTYGISMMLYGQGLFKTQNVSGLISTGSQPIIIFKYLDGYIEKCPISYYN